MIENTKFWLAEFSAIKPETQNIDKNKHIPGGEAGISILTSIFPNISAGEFRKFIKESTVSMGSPIKFFHVRQIENIKKQYAESQLEPNPIDMIAILFETISSLVIENRTLSEFEHQENVQLQEMRHIYPAARFSVTQIFENSALTESINRSVEQIERTVNTETSKFNKLTQMTFDQLLRAHTEAIGSQGQKIISNLQNEGSDMLEKKKNELVENLILQDVMELWDKKADNHQKWFRVGASLFFGMITIPILSGIVNFEEVAKFVQSVLPTQNSQPWGSLLIFTLPALGYAWVLRLVSRFTLQNLTLSDDAAQRSVMAKTFIRLAVENKAQEDPDRAIMLNALFRPIPGAKEQDLQPPTLADFINKQS